MDIKRRGFTLIEVLIATVILLLGILGSSAFYFANRRNLYNARLERYATWRAVEKMEYVKGLTYDSLMVGEEEEDIELGNLLALRTTTIAILEEDGVFFKEVNIRVEWENNNEVSIATYLYEK